MRYMILVALIVLCLLPACNSTGVESEGLDGDIIVRGSGAQSWPVGAYQPTPNFVWEYGTTGWHKGDRSPFHRMKTDLRLRFDPATNTIESVAVTSSEDGRAFRHVCLTPGTNGLLSIRMTTLLDDRDEDMTVVKVHGADPASHTCEEYGVGPLDGLVEGVDVLFREDGSYTILPNTGAYLAGAGLRLERKMTKSMDPTDVDEVSLP